MGLLSGAMQVEQQGSLGGRAEMLLTLLRCSFLGHCGICLISKPRRLSHVTRYVICCRPRRWVQGPASRRHQAASRWG